MNKFLLISFLLNLLGGCEWISQQKNASLFDSEQYQQEELLAYRHVLLELSPTVDYYQTNQGPFHPEKYLLFIKTDTLERLSSIRSDTNDFLPGQLPATVLNTQALNQGTDFKILLIPQKLHGKSPQVAQQQYEKFRLMYQPTEEAFKLSRILFNQTFTKGYFNYSFSRGSVVGGGMVCRAYLKKEKGRWKVIKKHCLG